ncbi:MAG: YbbR-like domain-containing protein [Candidatus Eisenbacteria bacterium]|uniref:YbbR-like domain-containing protein n=1 Tax=Eiseniibacteriota bacterium TaxID=2212470 RepID=A0A9D6L919_UNCEI|nr:YbbR-like domain-containing protein [Candidatus Eisenbacteria bacterium]
MLLAVLVYLNVYTDRPATQIVSFPLQFADLPDSLSVAGPIPAAVQAELRGTGKQLIRLRLTEPPLKLSLAGIGVGHYARAMTPADLPLPTTYDVQVERIVSPRTVELEIDRRMHRRLPVAARVEGVPSSGVFWGGAVALDPQTVVVSGPARAVARLDSVRLATVTIAAKRDTVNINVGADDLPDWCTITPEQVAVSVPLEPAATRRVTLPIAAPKGGEAFTVSPSHVTLTISAPRAAMAGAALGDMHVYWTGPLPLADLVGHRVALKRVGDLPDGARVRMDPDSVVLQRKR